MSNAKFQHIVLIGRSGVYGVPETLLALKDFLIARRLEVCLIEETAELIDTKDLSVVKSNQLPESADLIIVVGGDGSLLNAAHIAIDANLPVLGINRGRLGFLTDIHPSDLDKVGDVLDGNYTVEQRFFLSTTIVHEDRSIAYDIALNDVVLLPGEIVHMIEFEVHINDQFVCRQRADGIIVAGPTGSTAYALSGGGPILHPQLDAIVLVPMFPHTLSSRPIVVQGNSHIQLRIAESNDIHPFISCDGMERVAVPPGGVINIRKLSQHLQLIHPNDYNYFKTLREKLGWERHATRHHH